MIIKWFIFLAIFVCVIVTGVVSTWGWIKSDSRNVELAEENIMLLKDLANQGEELLEAKAEIGFLKLLLEEKENGK